MALLLGELGKLEANDSELSINLVDCVLQRGQLIVTKKTGVCACSQSFLLTRQGQDQGKRFAGRPGRESTGSSQHPSAEQDCMSGLPVWREAFHLD